MKRKLSSKQKLFVDEYLACGNATKAAIKAGYSHKTAKSIGAENLTKPDIKSAIKAKMAKIESHKIADATEVLQFFTSLLRAEIKETVAVAGPSGVETVELPPDLKTLMLAGKEIIKRYPNSDEMLQAQLTKAKAEAHLAELRVQNFDTGESVNESIAKFADLLTDQIKKQDNKRSNSEEE